MMVGCAAAPRAGGARDAGNGSGRPSALLEKHWPFDSAPNVIAFGDIDRFRATDLFGYLLKSSESAPSPGSARSFGDCVGRLAGGVHQIAAGANDRGRVLIVTFDASIGTPLRACLAGVDRGTPLDFDGAGMAWRMGDDSIAATSSDGVLVLGHPALVVKGLAGVGHGAGLDQVWLKNDASFEWTARIPEMGLSSQGSMVITARGLRLAGEAAFPTESLAVRAEEKFCKGEGPLALFDRSKRRSESTRAPGSSSISEEGRVGWERERLRAAFSCSRDENQVHAAFDLVEPPSQQARDANSAIEFVFEWLGSASGAAAGARRAP